MRKLVVGEKVFVRDLPIRGHRRTPQYVIKRSGVIERLCGEFRNPEDLAYGRSGLPKLRLYRVRFNQDALWDDYRGSPLDTLELELFEHWLEPVDTQNLRRCA